MHTSPEREALRAAWRCRSHDVAVEWTWFFIPLLN